MHQGSSLRVRDQEGGQSKVSWSSHLTSLEPHVLNDKWSLAWAPHLYPQHLSRPLAPECPSALMHPSALSLEGYQATPLLQLQGGQASAYFASPLHTNCSLWVLSPAPLSLCPLPKPSLGKPCWGVLLLRTSPSLLLTSCLYFHGHVPDPSCPAPQISRPNSVLWHHISD